jgi:hypothetical protein
MFVHPSLALWGSLLIALPVLIHLINMLRHRRVPWAAMEFLLESQRRNSAWIKLKQLLLLLARMAAVAGVVLLIAQPIGCNQLGGLLGGAKTQHVVLWDDSFSMADRWGNTTAFDEGRQVVERIADELARQPMGQSFTLLRFSRAGQGGKGPSRADLLREKVTSDFGRLLRELTRPMRASQLAVGPEAALEDVEKLVAQEADEDRVVYLVSDFRAKDWSSPGEAAETLSLLDRGGAQLRFIDCVESARPNLAIAALEPQRATRAAGVPFHITVTVANFGGEPVDDVSVLLKEDERVRPAVTIDRINPGERETRRFNVFFSTAGEHVVTASLGGDALETDNARFAVVDVPLSVPVLLIDGDPEQTNARYLATALAPGGAVKTGIDPRIEMPNYLNQKPLDKFQAVYLLDVGHLDPPAIAALEAYVRGGGGLGVFLGEDCRVKFYNEQLYRDGEGLFPLPLVAKTQLLVDRLEKGADLEVSDHPIFRVFADQRNGYLNSVLIDFYISAPKRWSPPPDSGTRVLAKLRNGAPLAIERKFGEGRVVAFTTTAAPTWNNWGRNPSYVVSMLEMQSYLASPSTVGSNRLVGQPIELELDPSRYQPEVRLISPAETLSFTADDETGDDPGSPTRQRGTGGQAGDDRRAAEAARAEADAVTVTAAPRSGERLLHASFADTALRGVYEVRLTALDNKTESRRMAFNVEPSEGDLATVGPEELSEQLKGVNFRYRPARMFHVDAQELAATNLSQWMIYLLVALLIGEQVLAYSAGYHPTRMASAADHSSRGAARAARVGSRAVEEVAQ